MIQIKIEPVSYLFVYQIVDRKLKLPTCSENFFWSYKVSQLPSVDFWRETYAVIFLQSLSQQIYMFKYN